MHLTGVIDLHVHTAPDIRERRMDDLALAVEARRVGVRAVVIKSHYVPTMDRAWLTRRVVPEVAVFGGVVLNPHVGGLNPQAVDIALRQGAKIVWLPTLFSARQRRLEGKHDGVGVLDRGQVLPQLQEILRRIAASNAILGTGHLSPEEIFTVVEEARRLGVQKILVNHPEHAVVGMSIEQQKQLAAHVFFERCYAQPRGGGQDHLNRETNLRAIQEVGPASTILASDGGQVENPPWSDVVRQQLEFLASHGVAAEALAWMSKTAPARLLDLPVDQNHDAPTV